MVVTVRQGVAPTSHGLGEGGGVGSAVGETSVNQLGWVRAEDSSKQVLLCQKKRQTLAMNMDTYVSRFVIRI
uniref:Uncharacterized protein n=1 Tax=Oryza sativa subsp. japonica TaxID=39947 RepID=Q5VMT4_ORYSJ|nr:hypothetical protein [Oryza sativa Japonica Group]BAD69241.1 hypothetical protein [Oryza sativa Japonica Group]